MPTTESIKPSGSSSDGQKHKHLNCEVRDMVSAVTHRLTNIHKPGSAQADQEEFDEDDDGVRIITLAGTNSGASLRMELEEKSLGLDGDQPVLGESDALRTHVNSNFQAINNSIMMGGSYNTNDPGVHMQISDFVDSKECKAEQKMAWKGKKKKKKESFKSGKTSDSDKSA